MRRLILIGLAATLSLAACTGTPEPGGPAPQPTATASPSCGLVANTLNDEKALYGAETVYNVVATAYLAAEEAGKLNPAQKSLYKSYVQDIFRWLGVAREAKLLGNTCDLYKAIENINHIQNLISVQLPKPS